MKTKKNTVEEMAEKHNIKIIYNNSLNAKNYTSSKLPKINAMLAKADLNTFLPKL